jgi:lipase
MLDVPQTTTGGSGRNSPVKSEPFQSYFDVPVAGGALTVARAGPAPESARAVVLALHGMTGTHMIYRTIARELCAEAGDICILAPDMRGRGRSAHLSEPHGMLAHVADLLAVLDHAGVASAIVAGHSMGCNVAARFAIEHPERAAAVLLLDSGMPILPEKVASEGTPGLFDRFETTFDSGAEYLAYWRGHPGLKDAWDEDVDVFVHGDFVEDEKGAHCVVNVDVVLADVADLTYDGVTWRAVTRVRPPVRLMRAERGMFDDDPLIPLPELDDFLREYPQISVELVPDVNHFTLVIGDGHGPRRVVATLEELADGM